VGGSPASIGKIRTNRLGNLAVMKTVFVLFLLCQSVAISAAECPVTIGSDGPYVQGWPSAKTWHGSSDFAVILPTDGVWATTRPGNRISVKLFWYVKGFQPGMENEFETTIRRLDDGHNDARVPKITNAGGSNLGAWTALAGIDFPSEGCWEITGRFRGKSLIFVVRTKIPAYRRNDAI